MKEIDLLKNGDNSSANPEKKLLRQLVTLLNQDLNDDSQDVNSIDTTLELRYLEQFKQQYTNFYDYFSENQYLKYFDRIFALTIEKRLVKKKWLNSFPNENIHLTLYLVRILLRDTYFHKYLIDNSNLQSISSLIDVFQKYLENHLKNDSVSIYAHIVENVLNILSKLITSNENSKFLLNLNAQNYLVQLIHSSKDLSLLHGSFNVLNLIAKYIDNRAKLVDLDICNQILIILQEYDNTTRRLAANYLRLMLSEDKIKSEISFLDGLRVLINLLSIENLEILWNIIWCLVQLSLYNENYKDIRLLGGIPLVLAILSVNYIDDNASSEQADNEERLKWILNIQSACCALVGELALNDTNSCTIVNLNGIYLIANKLVSNEHRSTSSHERVETLHANSLRALRIIYSIERHRSLIKKILPTRLIEEFVNIGNYKKDLKLYRSLLESYYKLSKDEKHTFKVNIQTLNQNQAPLNYINEYAIFEQIGSGGFGKVFKVKKKNSDYFLAMKEINIFGLNSKKDTHKHLSDVISEVTIIRNQLKHPNIVKYIKTFKEDKNLYIVMDLIDGLPLSQCINMLKEKSERFEEERVWIILIQILLALRYLHEDKKIVHRDLTPNNVMLSENDKVTITDFGLAKLKESDISMKSVVGTLYYSCPEIIKNESYDDKADVWSLGCLLYEMCTLSPPFYTSNMLSLATKIANGDYDSLPLDAYSTKIKLIVQKCLTVNAHTRPTAVELASKLVDRILIYTDSIRMKAANLERKFDKEKSKNQTCSSSICIKQCVSDLDLPKLIDSQKSIAKLPPIGQSTKTKFIMSHNKKDSRERGVGVSLRQQSASSIVSDYDVPTRIYRSSSSGAIEKRLSLSAKPRPSSANSTFVAPFLKKLQPVDDPIVLILEMLRKIIFISQQPPSDSKCIKRKLIDNYKRSLFSNRLSTESIKLELTKLVKSSRDLIDFNLLGLSSTQYYFNNTTNKSIHEDINDKQVQEILINGITYETLVNYLDEFCLLID